MLARLLVTFSIIAKSLTEATMTISETEYTYDGNAKNPSVTIKFESDGATGSSGAIGSVTTLTEGTDYDVTYKKMTGESEEDITASQIITAIHKNKYKAYVTKCWHILAIINKNLPYALYKRL